MDALSEVGILCCCCCWYIWIWCCKSCCCFSKFCSWNWASAAFTVVDVCCRGGCWAIWLMNWDLWVETVISSLNRACDTYVDKFIISLMRWFTCSAAWAYWFISCWCCCCWTGRCRCCCGLPRLSTMLSIKMCFSSFNKKLILLPSSSEMWIITRFSSGFGDSDNGELPAYTQVILCV